MYIKVFSIEKTTDNSLECMLKEYKKMISRFSVIEDLVLFNKQIAKAQTTGMQAAQEAYAKVYEPHVKGFNIALDVAGLQMDSFAFSKLMEDAVNINFFIGGAYGFNKEFLQKADKVISLSYLTYAHKIAKLVLYEQIYRGLCIKENHPYHK
ncbi:MAG: 23S rRNA (pseudouridine(1915)-N(3))-methyltransferase RlmH [Sulfurospirillum sp.]|nr:23S rRNA (pseudouridine(1915)-N(3))-methyltransferase RlmH [Sulfurospirillum sp.]